MTPVVEEVQCVSPAPRDVWRAIVESSPEATVFQTPEWLDACCKDGRYHDASRLYERPSGRQLVLPLVRRARPGARSMWSMPAQWGFGGILAPDRVRPDDAAVVASQICASGVRTVVKPGPLTAAPWAGVPAPVRFGHTVHVIDLAEGLDGYLKRLSSDLRYKVRRAERKGVTVEWEATGRLVPVAWNIHLRWSANRASRRGIRETIGIAGGERGPHGGVRLNQLRAVARELGGRCRVGIASVDGEAAAFAFMLVNGQHAHYWRSASDETLARGRYPNHVLLVRLVEEAATIGCRFVHLGESGGVHGLEYFKESLGGNPCTYDELRFENRIATAAVHARDWTQMVITRVVVGGAQRLKKTVA